MTKEKQVLLRLVEDQRLELSAKDGEIMRLEGEVQFTMKKVQMMNVKATSKLDDILAMGRPSNGRIRAGLGYEGSNPLRNPSFVKNGTDYKNEAIPKSVMTDFQMKGKTSIVCHYCGISGHIRPRCYRMHRDVRFKRNSGSSNDGSRHEKIMKVWVRKPIYTCRYGHIFAQSLTQCAVKSCGGCSKLVTNKSDYSKLVETKNDEAVTFEEGTKINMAEQDTLQVSDEQKVDNSERIDHHIGTSQVLEEMWEVRSGEKFVTTVFSNSQN